MAQEVFIYKVKNQNGYSLRGIIHAQSQAEVYDLLQGEGIALLSLRPFQEWQRSFVKVAFRNQEALEFFRSLEQLMRSGVSLLESLRCLTVEAGKYPLYLVTRLLEKGKSFSQVLQETRLLENTLILSFLSYAEYDGDYPKAFQQITAYLTWQNNLKNSLKKALSYPLLILGLSTTLIVFLITVLVPRLLELFMLMDCEPPSLTSFLAYCGNHVVSWLTCFLVGVIGGVGGGYFFLRQAAILPNIFKKICSLLFEIPWIGERLREILLLRYIGGLQVLLSSQSCRIVEAMDLATQSLRPLFFSPLFKEIQERVACGESFSWSLRESGLLTPTLFTIVVVGEKSGRLPDNLKYLVTFIEYNFREALGAFSKWLGPCLLVMIGVILIFIIFAVFVPLYSGIGSFE